MSIDISYFSFNADRADSEWVNFAEDIVPLMHNNRIRGARMEQSEDYTKLRLKEDETVWEPMRRKKRLEIFKLYEDEGLYIPGVDWEDQSPNGNERPVTSKDKMEYLLIQGPLFPKGHSKVGPFPPKFMYVDDREDWQKFLKEIEKFQDEFLKKHSAVSRSIDPVELTERQKKLDDGASVSFTYGKSDKKQIILDLINVDLFYGSVIDNFHEPASSYESVVEEYGLNDWGTDQSFESDPQTWFDIYAELNPSSVEEHRKSLAEINDWDESETKGLIEDFFLGIKPLIKDLKDNPKSILIRCAQDDLEPKSAQKLLKERAEKHYEQFKEIIET